MFFFIMCAVYLCAVTHMVHKEIPLSFRVIKRDAMSRSTKPSPLPSRITVGIHLSHESQSMVPSRSCSLPRGYRKCLQAIHTIETDNSIPSLSHRSPKLPPVRQSHCVGGFTFEMQIPSSLLPSSASPSFLKISVFGSQTLAFRLPSTPLSLTLHGDLDHREDLL